MFSSLSFPVPSAIILENARTMASADTLPLNKASEEDADMFDDATDGPASSSIDDGGGNNTTTAVTDAHEKSVQQQLASNPPPAALPTGWFLKPSQINAPGNYYYFNQDTGECGWELPATASSTSAMAAVSAVSAVSQESLNATAAAAAAAVKSILKRAEPSTATEEDDNNNDNSATIQAAADNTVQQQVKSSSTTTSHRKKQKTEEKEKHREKHHHHSSSSSSPKEVRVLHILKKHKDSRRPASWRNPKITISKQKAIAELHELLSIISESSSSSNNPTELRATFEELAKTESDCSSAKRGGDLGFFGRKKMQPAFEKASFGLRVGELTREVVDTSSGVHIILRLA